MMSGLPKQKESKCWSPPPMVFLIFDKDGATKGKLSVTGIGGILQNEKEKVLLCLRTMWSKRL